MYAKKLLLFIFLFLLSFSFVSAVAEWHTDSSIVSGLSDVGAHSTPTITYNFSGNNKWTLISGNNPGGFNGFQFEVPCYYPGSGNWDITISNNCSLSSETISGNLTISGSSGSLTINGNVTADKISIEPSDFNGDFLINILTGSNFGVVI